jgi:S-adenosyl-L-methionine hydrolase (adenosine-forming)
MPLITLTSDLGIKDNYVALVKASILRLIPNASVIDISHEIEKFNIMHAAYIFGNAYTFFPEDTIHLVGIKSHIEASRFLIVELHKQKIICLDNGFFTLLPNLYNPTVLALNEQAFPPTLFYLKDAMTTAASQLLKHEKIGVPCSDYHQLMQFQPTASSDTIIGRCLHIDSFGNVVTNITRHFFDLVCKGRKYTIHLPGAQINKIVSDYSEVPETNALALFNTFGYLEIAINKAKASQLLFPKQTHINIDFNITVQFED